jgi:hypothetical protein
MPIRLREPTVDLGVLSPVLPVMRSKVVNIPSTFTASSGGTNELRIDD